MTASKRREKPMIINTLLETGRTLAQSIPYGLVALLSRFAVASVFWRSGQTKVSGFHIREETFVLFREEYKVPLLPPDVAAYISTIGEHVFPVLLVVGLASRLSALGLLGMTMVIQLFVFPDGWPDHILWDRAAGANHRARSRHNFARSCGLGPRHASTRTRAVTSIRLLSRRGTKRPSIGRSRPACENRDRGTGP